MAAGGRAKQQNGCRSLLSDPSEDPSVAVAAAAKATFGKKKLQSVKSSMANQKSCWVKAPPHFIRKGCMSGKELVDAMAPGSGPLG